MTSRPPEPKLGYKRSLLLALLIGALMLIFNALGRRCDNPQPGQRTRWRFFTHGPPPLVVGGSDR